MDLSNRGLAGRNLLCGGAAARKPVCPNPPPPSSLLRRRAGRGSSAPGGGGGIDPNIEKLKMTPVALIILTTHIWGGGGRIFGEKKLSGQNLCSRANIRPYTKQRARHGSPFLQPPPLLRWASMSPPPPQQFSGCPCSKSNTCVCVCGSCRARPTTLDEPTQNDRLWDRDRTTGTVCDDLKCMGCWA